MKSNLNNSRLSRQRRRHFFESHILRVLAINYSNKSITQQAKLQTNTLLMTVCNLIVAKTLDLLKLTEKKTITEKELEAAVHLVLNGQLAQNSIQVGHNTLAFYHSNQEHISKSLRAEVVISPSILDKFLRETSGCHVSEGAPIFLAGIIEYFLIQILELANIQSKKLRITMTDLENGIHTDPELCDFLTQHHLWINGAHQTIISRRIFETKIKEPLERRFPDLRFEKNCFADLQGYIEKWLINLLIQSFSVTLHCKRHKMIDTDIDLALTLSNNRVLTSVSTAFQPSYSPASIIHFDSIPQLDDPG